MNEKKVIYPHGIVVILLLLFCSIAPLVLGLVILFAIITGLLNLEAIYFFGAVGTIIMGITVFYELFIRGKILFENGRCIYKPKNPDKIMNPKFSVKCEDILKFKILGGVDIEFITVKGEKQILSTLHFSPKQRIKILYEIQNHGGLQGHKGTELCRGVDPKVVGNRKKIRQYIKRKRVVRKDLDGE